MPAGATRILPADRALTRSPRTARQGGALLDVLTDADLTAEYWGHSNVSDWQVGSTWEHQRTDGTCIAEVVGTIVESVAPTRLVSTWAAPGEDLVVGASRVTSTSSPMARSSG